MSNFNWTDKESVRWFLLLPAGHEGPYSLIHLEQRLSQGHVLATMTIWAEGLESPISLEEALVRSLPLPSLAPTPPAKVPKVNRELPSEPDEGPPPLPVLEPEEKVVREFVLTLPPETPLDAEVPVREKRRKRLVFGALAATVLCAVILQQWIQGQRKFEISRAAKMDPELHKKIERTMEFGGWGKKIFFKEFVPQDMSRIWLVTASFQTCAIRAKFSSLEGKLLSMSDKEVEFTSETRLAGHLAEFSKFSFLKGSKIIPGLYELELEARDCEWDGILPLLANRFSSPNAQYEAQMKVVLYPKGPEEFGEVLDKVARKRLEQKLRSQNQEELFWQDLQLKYDTLLAVSLQIEQLFLEMLDKDDRRFGANLKAAVEQYTSAHGRFLTDFVVANEEYFRELAGLRDLSLKKNYESRVRLMAKKIGLETMKFIEAWQSMKSTRRANLEREKEKVKAVFRDLKAEINQRILQSSEERSN